MKTIGIIGGMGPLAGADLFSKIIEETEAKGDCEQPPVLLSSDTAIPDRSLAVAGLGQSPLPRLIQNGQTLINAGAELLCLGCNTAHFYYEALQEAFGEVPLLNMVTLSARRCRERGYKQLILLAAPGTYRAGVYSRAFKDTGVQLLYPDEKTASLLGDVIYKGVKAGNWRYPAEGLKAALQKLPVSPERPFLLGCTELPIAFRAYRIEGPAVDPGVILAREAVRLSGARLKGETPENKSFLLA